MSSPRRALARTLMVQGTASSAGKSLMVTALCRIFRQEGYSVAPYKSQNMALNSAVTPDGLEIGRAQAVQARAAGIPAHVDMNPILLKPEGAARCQVVVNGRPYARTTAREYQAMKRELEPVVATSLGRLRQRHDVVVIEGAGSPAEINLAEQDIVNMHVARIADAPVLLVGDIDRGGVFASIIGTMELLPTQDRSRVAAFIVNKFRGDPSLLTSGLDFLTERTGVPVLGVVPHLEGHRIPEEDSVGLEGREGRRRAEHGEVEVAVVRLPHISNYDDLTPLEDRTGVVVRFVSDPDELDGCDLVVLPGSKATLRDLRWLRESGFAARIVERAHAGEPILGICGGCQMLGLEIADPSGVEGEARREAGLGLLALRTRFEQDKRTAQVRAEPLFAGWFAVPPAARVPGASGCEGYEIHMGRVTREQGARPAFRILERNGVPGEADDGAIDENGTVIGTMIHGLFESPEVANALLSSLRERRGLEAPALEASRSEDPYDVLADHVRGALDADLLQSILNGRAGSGR